MKVCQYCSHKCEDSVSICPSCGSNQFYSEIELQKRQDRLRAEEEKWKIAEDAQKQRARKLLGALFAIVIVVVAGISIISYVRASKPYRDAGITRSETKEYLEAGISLFDNGNYEVGVHIADVTHYVKEGDIIDKEAYSRATSVYLVDRTVPMLPEKLCNMVCSLRPDEEKLTYSVIFEITPKAEEGEGGIH